MSEFPTLEVYPFPLRHPICLNHYENTPIQIYRKFHLQKLKIFRKKNNKKNPDIFYISAQKTDCGVPMSTHNQCFLA